MMSIFMGVFMVGLGVCSIIKGVQTIVKKVKKDSD